MLDIQQRDPRALDLLFQRYRALLKSVILRVVHNHSAADDVMQDCMLETWHHASKYIPEKGTPLAWIVTLAKRRAIDNLRRQQTYASATDRFETDLRANGAASLRDDAASDCEAADLGRMLRDQLTRLPSPQEEALRLAFLKGMSQREVARATSTPLGTVKTRIELGLKKLRHALRICDAELARA